MESRTNVVYTKQKDILCKDHGMMQPSVEESDTLPMLTTNWAKYRIDHRRLSTHWTTDKSTRDRVMGGAKAKTTMTPMNPTV